MFELVIVVALVVLAVMVTVIPWASLLVAGVVTTIVGLVFGVATGFWYHVALARALAPSNALTQGWWLRPVPLHPRLDAVSRRRVMPWFYAGAVGFVVTVVGLVVIALGVAVGFWRTA